MNTARTQQLIYAHENFSSHFHPSIKRFIAGACVANKWTRCRRAAANKILSLNASLRHAYRPRGRPVCRDVFTTDRAYEHVGYVHAYAVNKTVMDSPDGYFDVYKSCSVLTSRSPPANVNASPVDVGSYRLARKKKKKWFLAPKISRMTRIKPSNNRRENRVMCLLNPDYIQHVA